MYPFFNFIGRHASAVACLSLLTLLVTIVAISYHSTAGAEPAVLASPSPQAGRAIRESYGNLPLGFEVNAGQTDPHVKYFTRGQGYGLFLTTTEAVFKLKTPGRPAPAVLRMTLEGSSEPTSIDGLDALRGKTNYIKGPSTEWRTGVTSYQKVRYTEVYPGIDLIYFGNRRQLEYDFIVAPGADPGAIGIRFEGAGTPRVADDGSLTMEVEEVEVRQHRPLVYQDVNGSRREVPSGYKVSDTGLVTFEIAEYDPALPLVIDPVLVYSSYLGGGAVSPIFSSESGDDIAVDREGAAYITGSAESASFPTTANAFQPELAGETDAFVTKVSPDGSEILYSTFLGGSASENRISFGDPGITVDAAGCAYVTGTTGSGDDFPTTPGAFQRSGGSLFVSKLDPTGSMLVYSTLLGYGVGDAIAVDAAGHAYVTGGITIQDGFPTRNPLQTTPGTAFVLKLNQQGSDLVFSTPLGGTSRAGGHQSDDIDYGSAIAVDAAGNVYVGGRARSPDFPVLNAAQPVHGGSTLDGFVTKIHASGSFLMYSTFLGGGDRDMIRGLAIDSTSSVYVAGFTASDDFPVVNPLQPQLGGDYDAFVTRLSPAGSAFTFSTYLGGSSTDVAWDLALDIQGSIYISGLTQSADFPVVRPLSSEFGSGVNGDAFVTKLSAGGSSVLYSTFLGGDWLDIGRGLAVDAAGSAYITGSTFTPGDFPTVNAFQPQFGGAIDAFVAKISDESGACPPEISDRFQMFRLGVQILWFTPFRFEWVLIRNISTGPIAGPLALVIDDVRNGIFIGSAFRTSCISPEGDPLLLVPLDRDGVLSPDESTLAGLWFVKTRLPPIGYSTRVLAIPPR